MSRNITIITIIIIIIFILKIPAHAQFSTCNPAGGRLKVDQGLVSTPLGNTFSTTSGVCIIGPETAFKPFEIPTYADLKSLYYDQIKPSILASGLISKHQPLLGIGDKTENDIPFESLNPNAANATDVYYIQDGDLNISGKLPSVGSGIIFVEKNLNILSDYKYDSKIAGTVFVVKENVNIASTVKQVDAVIISSGTICTAYNGIDGIGCPSQNIETEQLVINGSLISINETKPIKFRRSLLVNTEPAEKINHQVKYLVILKDAFADTQQRWSEIQ